MESDLVLLMVNAHLSRDETLLRNLTISSAIGTTLTYTTQLDSFGSTDSGNYTCTAVVRPQPNATYLTGNETIQSNAINIRAGI